MVEADRPELPRDATALPDTDQEASRVREPPRRGPFSVTSGAGRGRVAIRAGPGSTARRRPGSATARLVGSTSPARRRGVAACGARLRVPGSVPTRRLRSHGDRGPVDRRRRGPTTVREPTREATARGRQRPSSSPVRTRREFLAPIASRRDHRRPRGEPAPQARAHRVTDTDDGGLAQHDARTGSGVYSSDDRHRAAHAPLTGEPRGTTDPRGSDSGAKRPGRGPGRSGPPWPGDYSEMPKYSPSL